MEHKERSIEALEMAIFGSIERFANCGRKALALLLLAIVLVLPGATLAQTVIVDNLDPNTEVTGTWSVSSGPNPWEVNSVFSDGGSTFRWLPEVPVAGVYEVYAW